jgi:predicted ATPase
MFAREVQSFETARLQAGRVFFDRGVPDVAGYLRLVGVEIPERIDQAARRLRYRRQVFVAPPWPAIFENDAERKQTFDEAIRTHDVLVDTYRAYEYELIVLPLVPVAERVAFVLDSLT